jgi:chromosome segregation protein
MYLKSLQVVGFKSFADRTTINFDRGVTAVVGPNGCGKSNVLDSIRWVLGEQSAKALRGGNMQDVIFSGTESRKALGLAEVSMTFGNCEKDLGVEYNEVTITRRVFRDGAGEYEINKTPCRLRDIHQLFMDTGIGRTAYSIMEQGKIDMILSSRPEDRRAIFEEAAGITKYKSQKKEALRKLEHTESNLIRIADIIREVKRQIGSLQRQAGKARRYKELLDDLKGMETQLAKHQFDQLTSYIDGLQFQVEGAREQQEQLSLDLESKDMELAELRLQLEATETEISDVRGRQNHTTNALDRATQHKQVNESRVTEFADLSERCRLEVSATEEKIRVQEEQLRSISEQLETAKISRGGAESAYEQKQEEAHLLNARMSAVEAQRAEQEEQALSLEQNLARLRNELAALELQQRNFLFRVENLKTEQGVLAQKNEEASRRLTAHQAEFSQAEQALLTAQEEESTAAARQKEAAEAVRKADEASRAAQQEMHSLQAQKDALVRLNASHAGSPDMAKKLLAEGQAGNAGAEILGTLADHIRVQPGYELPVSILLGDSVNALLIQDLAAAQALLSKIQTDEAGHLLLAPLQMTRLPVHPGGEETSAQLFVSADELSTPLLTALLADAHIVADLEAAWALKASHPQANIVTLKGERISGPGLIWLGQKEDASLSVLSRHNEIRKLDLGLSEAAAKAATLRGLWENALACELETAALRDAARQKTQEARILTATLKQKQQSLREAADEALRQQESAAQEILRLSAQDQTDHRQQAEIRQALEQKQQESDALRETLDRLSGEIADYAKKESALGAELTESRILLATQTQQCESWEKQREPIALRLLELRELVETRAREAADYSSRIETARAEIVRAEAETGSAREALAVLQAELEQKCAQRTEQHQRIEERETVLRGERKKLSELQEARSEHEIRLAAVKMELGQLRDRIQRAYQLELESLPALEDSPETPVDWAALQTAVDEKRNRLDEMGPVNLEAITEYDELEERHKFLETQQADLINAKEQLLQAITHINQTTKKLFAETFEQIRNNFKEMFIELFGGGKADLVLAEGEDPLEAGIDIVAKPPGKQLQSITLLSGGEKTMTAVALLFSIYMVKPSPFCVLDEMDAPLDESNIGRFIKILGRFVAQSQFVVITHNKKTISAADAIYGVTMEEHGVSRLVSVKLNKKDEPPKTPLAAAAVDPAVPSVAESFGKMTEVSV